VVGWDYQTERAQHQSQTDTKVGFGGRFGVQKDRQDKVNIYYITEAPIIIYCIAVGCPWLGLSGSSR